MRSIRRFALACLCAINTAIPVFAFQETENVIIEPQFCSLYPLTISESLVSALKPGDIVTDVELGTGPGNYSWLSWDGTNSAPDIAARLIYPGNSNTYVNLSVPEDHQLDVGDWVEGVPGVKNSSEIRTHLDDTLGKNIILPVWQLYKDAGSKLNYQVSQFAIVKLTDYRLSGKGFINFEFQRFTRCYNERPVAHNLEFEVLEDQSIEFELPVTDSDNNDIEVSEFSDVANGLLSVDASELRAVYTPRADFNGVDGFEYIAHDFEQLSSKAVVTITIIPVNDAPVAYDAVSEGLEDSLIELVFFADDIDSTELTFKPELGDQPGQILHSSEGFFYQPEQDFNGEITFTYQAYDGELYSSDAQYTVTVNPVNDAPVVQNYSFELKENTQIMFEPVVTDIDSSNYQLMTDKAPENGIIQIDSGKVTYIPHAGFYGQDKWTYQADDLADGPNDFGTNLSNIGEVVFTVLKINEPPEIVSLALELTDESSLYSYPVIAKDPNERDQLFFSLLSAPDAMSVDALSGEIQWSPDNSWTQATPTFNKQCYVVPTGSVKLYENGDDNNTLAYIAPLFQQVTEAIETAGDYTAKQSVVWHKRNYCLGCHIQTQSLLGLQASKEKAEIDIDSAEYLLTEILKSQQSDGSIRRSHPGYAKTQTAFALWSLSYVPEVEKTLDVRGKALQFMINRRHTNSTGVYWSTDHSTGWMRDYDSITSVVALSGARYLKDLAKMETVTAAQQSYAEAFSALIDPIVNFELSRAYGNENETLWLAFRQIALAELEPLVVDEAKAQQIRAAIATIDGRLRNRQTPAGGWARYGYSDHTDPLTSAWVGLALNYLNPPLADPVVTNNIKYLLESQAANGTWVTTSGLFSTHLATTSLVMAYLPVALEHLGNPDVYAGTIHLREDDYGQHSLVANIRNRGLADIVVPVNVSFYNGPEENAQLIGQVTVEGLLSGEKKPAILNILPEEVTEHVFVRLESSVEAEECEITNNASHAALVEVQVEDPSGETDSQRFLLNVLDVNEAPEIVSEAPTEHQGGQGLSYKIQVEDADEGDGHQFAIIAGPENVYIDANTGKLTAPPGALLPGIYTVVVQVTDLRGESDTQTITFTVYQNLPPKIISVAIVEGDEQLGYVYDVEAVDPNAGDTLVYGLEIFPSLSSIGKNDGVIEWPANQLYTEAMATQNEFCLGGVSAAVGSVDLVTAMSWSANGAPYSNYNQVMMAPIVTPLYDTNNDGRVTADDEKVILISTFTGSYYARPGFLRAISAKTGNLLWTSAQSIGVLPEGSLAAADIDKDGFPEIAVPVYGGGIALLEHTGELKWRSSKPDFVRWGGATIADLEGDGDAEVVVGRTVLDTNGNVKWSIEPSLKGNGAGPLSLAADINLDGYQEVISGGYVYDYQGNLLWQAGDGFSAMANFDEDDFAEIVLVSSGSVNVFNHDGSAYWSQSVPIPGGGVGGAPTVADLDGDGEVEIGVAGANAYVAFETDGTVLWQSPTRDASSHKTGSSVFDFNGDGRSEVVYADEYYLRVYDGPTGEVLHQSANTSGTTYEMPVIADVDDDYHAEIVVISNSYAFGGFSGVRVMESDKDDWAPTRSIWNQHAYNINNINDDLTVPVQPEKSWLTHNTFRLNTFPDRPALGLADVTVHNIRFDEATNTVSADVVNRGLAPVNQPLAVSFTHIHNWLDPVVLGEVTLPALSVNESQTVSVVIANVEDLVQVIEATVTVADSVKECLTDNNSARAHMMQASVFDDAGEFDLQTFAVSIQNRNERPFIVSSANSSAVENTAYSHQIEVLDSDRGDDHHFSLINAPAGLEIDEYSGEISSDGLPVGVYTFGIQVTDLAGLSDEQTHLLTVVLPDNFAPVISSTPTAAVTLGDQYSYQVIATDPDGDDIQFFMSRSQPGLRIDNVSGLLTWRPGEADLGVKSAEVSVIDINGAVAKQYFLIDVLAPVENNNAPNITSVPSGNAVAGLVYEYLVEANDPDGDALNYRIESDVQGMSIDQTGRVSWLVDAQYIGSAVIFDVIVDDGRGASASQRITMPVNDAANSAPVITSLPGQQVYANDFYEYNIEATDADNDAFTISLLESPDGMALVGSRLEWTPSALQAQSEYLVSIQVTDARGSAALQSFGIYVSEQLPPNDAPAILSQPTSPAFIGEQYTYQVVATDINNDTLTYSLDSTVSGMTIDSAGQLSWTPAADQVGTHAITVRVSDGRAWVAQSFYLDAVEAPVVDENGHLNNAPAITSTPRTEAVQGKLYQYQLQATDVDGNTLVLAAPTLPDGATFDAAGLLSWQPSSEQVGIHEVMLEASDGQIRAIQSFSIAVMDSALPIDVFVDVQPEYPNFGDLVEIQVLANGGEDVLTKQVIVNGTEYQLDEYGRTSVLANNYGLNDIYINVTDGVETITVDRQFSVVDPTDSTAPSVTLHSPADGSEVTAPSDVYATIEDASLRQWQLIVKEKGSAATEYQVIATGNSNVSNNIVGQFDPTLLHNGQYSLIVVAEDTNGQTSQDAVNLLVDGDFKVGHFALTFEDLNIDLAGIPISVSRTYDTRQRHDDLDFGKGWSIDYQNVRIQESRTLGFSWSLNEYRNGFFGEFCVEPNGNPIVAIRLPGGQVEKFRATATPDCSSIVPTIDVNLSFEPIDGTRSTLTQSDYGLIRIVNGDLMDLGDPYGPVDPDHYTLTTQDGMVYQLDQGFGIRRVIEPEGQSITYSDSGIQHSLGYKIDFEKDAYGRITALVLPDGRRVEYRYDLNGDLVASTDLSGATTDYSYLRRMPHYLDEMIDPRGVRATKMVYDDSGRLISVIDAMGNEVIYDHDIDGQTETVYDRNGNPSTFVYDERGNVLVETNAEGESTYRTYTEYGDVLTETNALGETTTWTYNSKGFQTSETNHKGEVTSWTYSSNGEMLTETNNRGEVVLTNAYNEHTLKLVSSTDALGNTTSFHWDSGMGSCGTGASKGYTDALGNRTSFELICYGDQAGKVRSETTAAGVKTDYSYDATGRKISETTYRTDEHGSLIALTTAFEYDSADRIIKVTNPDGTVSETIYDAIGQVVAEIDINGQRTEYRYTDRGEEWQVHYPDGTYSSKEYDANGNVIAEIDRGGRITQMLYDKANRLIATIYPDETPLDDSDNPRTLSEYDNAGRLIASVDAKGNRTEYDYDDAGRRTLIRDALLHETVIEYDDLGRKQAMVDANASRIEYIYDALDRQIATHYPDGSSTSVVFDAIGRKISETDELGRVTQFEYDSASRLTKVIDPYLNETTYSYDEQGNKLTQTDAEQNTTRWTYDDQGRVTSRMLPEGQVELFDYEVNGNLRSHTDFNGQTTYYSYNPVTQQQVLVDYPNDADVSTVYTPTGQVDSVTNGEGTTSYRYDAQYRIDRIDYPSGLYIEYAYDSNGNRTLVRTAYGDVHYGYDALNRLQSVSDANGTTLYSYTPVGSRDTVLFPNGVTTDYDYDSRNRLTRIETLDANGLSLLGISYTLNLNSTRQSITEDSGRITHYEYDLLDRLTKETVTDARYGDSITDWSYDKTANRLSQTVSDASGINSTSYQYDGNDRLISETDSNGTTVYQYDANGNTTQTISPAGVIDYQWNDDNRMVLSQGVNGDVSSYQYDVHGIRQSQAINGNATRYLIDPNTTYAYVIAELDGSGGLQVLYTHGDDLISQSRSGSTRFYHADGLGSTRVLTNPSGTQTDRYVYEAFGELEAQEGDTENNYLFTGEQYDPNLGFYYLRARYMNPANGRFVSQDSWMGRSHDPLTLHKYAYANLDPVSMVDRSGYMSIMGQNAAVSGMMAIAVRTTIHFGRAISRTLVGAAMRGGVQAIRNEVKRCVRSKGRNCRISVPLIVAGNSHPNQMQHIKDAQSGNGENFGSRRITPVLSYQSYKINRASWPKTTFPSGFTISLGTPLGLPSCGVLDKASATVKYGTASLDCDEYPFNMSKQGGFSNYKQGRVSARFIPKVENQMFGSVYIKGATRGLERGDKYIVIAADYLSQSMFIPKLSKR